MWPDNDENHENPRTQFENHENNENHISPTENNENQKFIKFQSIIKKQKPIIEFK